MSFRSLQEISHPIFERVRMKFEGQRDGRDFYLFDGPTFEEVQGAFEHEAEARGCGEAIPSSGPVKDGSGVFVLYAKLAPRNSSVADPFREFINFMSRGVGR